MMIGPSYKNRFLLAPGVERMYLRDDSWVPWDDDVDAEWNKLSKLHQRRTIDFITGLVPLVMVTVGGRLSSPGFERAVTMLSKVTFGFDQFSPSVACTWSEVSTNFPYWRKYRLQQVNSDVYRDFAVPSVLWSPRGEFALAAVGIRSGLWRPMILSQDRKTASALTRDVVTR